MILPLLGGIIASLLAAIQDSVENDWDSHIKQLDANKANCLAVWFFPVDAKLGPRKDSRVLEMEMVAK